MTGFVVPPNDPAAIGDRLEQIRRDPARAATMGRAARARVLERFTWDRVVQRCLEAYEGSVMLEWVVSMLRPRSRDSYAARRSASSPARLSHGRAMRVARTDVDLGIPRTGGIASSFTGRRHGAHR